MMVKMVSAVAVAAAATLIAGSGADAQSGRKGNVAGYVTTCSTYGNGCTKAPVRRGRYGYEFRLPGGTWVGCRRDCRTALRQESVDFWETQRENQRDR
jgi:hypothetical protein